LWGSRDPGSEEGVVSDFISHFTTDRADDQAGGQVDAAHPGTAEPGESTPPCDATVNKYGFDLARSVLLDAEVYRDWWLVGLYFYDRNEYRRIVCDRAKLATTLDAIARGGLTLVTYNGTGYDVPILRAILGGRDPYLISQQIVAYDGRGLPPALRDVAQSWPRIKADHVDLAARTRRAGYFPSLKSVAANLACRELQELPFDPLSGPLSDAQRAEVEAYNKKDLQDTKAVLDHFAPELHALASLSERYQIDLRNVHPAGVAGAVLVADYHRAHGRDPVRLPTPTSVHYHPPAPVRRPRTGAAAAWFDRLTGEEFPLAVPARGEHPKPVVPEADPIIIGGVEISVGGGGIHSSDRPRIHRPDQECEVLEADVRSFYPSMMDKYGLFPSALGDTGLVEFREILRSRLEIKERAAIATDPAEAQDLKRRADGLKLVLNSVFGQCGNPYSPLHDPATFLTVTLSGQLLLLDLCERLVEAGVQLLSCNTDGVYLKVRRGDEGWRKVLDAWESDTSLTLETLLVELLIIEATNNYAVKYPDGRWKRRGSLSDEVTWDRVPAGGAVACAVLAALEGGVLPEVTVRGLSRDPAKFAFVTRRDRGKAGFLIDDRSGTETPMAGRLSRWYKGLGSPFRIEYRWVDKDGKAHRTTPPGATNVQLLMVMPAPGETLGDIDFSWYAGEARRRVMQFPDFPHTDPKWLADSEIALDLHRRGLVPCPKWEGKKSPKGSKIQYPSYLWDWSAYDAYGTWTGAAIGLLVIDVDEPGKWSRYLLKTLGNRQLPPDCLTSFHRKDTPEDVRMGRARGKLVFRLADPENPLASIGPARLKAATGVEVFYGKGGIPTLLGAHPDGVEHDYCLDGVLGPLPEPLAADLTAKAGAKSPKPKPKAPAVGRAAHVMPGEQPPALAQYAEAALEGEADRVAAAEEGTRNTTLWSSACHLGELVGAGAIDREVVEERLAEATSLPTDEACDVIRRGLAKGEEHPRDLAYVGSNGRHRPGAGDGDDSDSGGGGGGSGGDDGGDVGDDPRPIVAISTEEHATNDAAIEALAKDPHIYQRSHLLVRVLREPPRPDDAELNRDPGAAVIVPVQAPTLRERLTSVARWVTPSRGDDDETKYSPAHPPGWAVSAILRRGCWPGVRRLEQVTEVPVFLASGRILETPGYDRRSGILFQPEVRYPRIPARPSREDARAAANELFAVVRDFPFQDKSHRAGWLAGLLTVLARPAIDGCVPLFLVDANAPRTGKSLLCDLISVIAVGRQAGRTTYPPNEEEASKIILRSREKITWSFRSWRDLIVPIAVKVYSCDLNPR
jgi:hypothetical protein